VLSRAYCHLCHDMVAALGPLGVTWPFELRIIDVDADPALEARYGDLVPVLLAGDREICHYHLDYAALHAYLTEIQ
jgi:thioredoxin reductase (NADPH)